MRVRSPMGPKKWKIPQRARQSTKSKVLTLSVAYICHLDNCISSDGRISYQVSSHIKKTELTVTGLRNLRLYLLYAKVDTIH